VLGIIHNFCHKQQIIITETPGKYGIINQQILCNKHAIRPCFMYAI
jgi:hypothetical protein